jgi:hypothetical protein
MPPVRKLRVLAFASIIDLTDEPKVNVARLDLVQLRPLIDELKRGRSASAHAAQGCAHFSKG